MFNVFKDKDGNVSSIRSGNKHTQFTTYFNKKAGGMTIRNNGFTTRLNISGQCIGTAFKSGNRTAYFDKNGKRTSHLTAF